MLLKAHIEYQNIVQKAIASGIFLGLVMNINKSTKNNSKDMSI